MSKLLEEINDIRRRAGLEPMTEQRPYMGGISYDDDYEDEQPELEYYQLHAGMTLYHGTSSEDFNELEEELTPPTWFSEGPGVAKWFARGYQEGDKPRLLTFKVTQDYRLLLIQDRATIEMLGEYYGIETDDTREMAEDVCSRLGVEGWIIPNNYPQEGGSDILLCHLDGLEFVDVKTLTEGKIDDIWKTAYNEGNAEGFKKAKMDMENKTVDQKRVEAGFHDPSKLGRITRSNAYEKAYVFGYQDGYYDAITGGYRS